MRADTAARDCSTIYGQGAVTPLTILGSSKLKLDLNPDIGVTFGIGSKVASIADQSGNGNSPSQAVSGSQPTLATNVLNGHSALQFSGSQYLERLSFAGLSAGGSARVYAIGSWTAATPNTAQGVLISLALSAVLGTGNCMTLLRFNSANGLVWQLNAGSPSFTGDTAGLSSVPALFDGRLVGGTETHAINNVDVVSVGSVSNFGTVNRLHVGVREDTTTQLLSGQVLRLLVVAPVPTAADHAALITYFKSQYPALGIA